MQYAHSLFAEDFNPMRYTGYIYSQSFIKTYEGPSTKMFPSLFCKLDREPGPTVQKKDRMPNFLFMQLFIEDTNRL